MQQQQQPVAPVKRVDVTLSSDSEEEQAGMKTAATAAGAGDGVGGAKSDGAGKLATSSVKTQ